MDSASYQRCCDSRFQQPRSTWFACDSCSVLWLYFNDTRNFRCHRRTVDWNSGRMRLDSLVCGWIVRFKDRSQGRRGIPKVVRQAVGYRTPQTLAPVHKWDCSASLVWIWDWIQPQLYVPRPEQELYTALFSQFVRCDNTWGGICWIIRFFYIYLAALANDQEKTAARQRDHDNDVLPNRSAFSPMHRVHFNDRELCVGYCGLGSDRNWPF